MATHGTVTGKFVGTDGTTPAAGSVIFSPAPQWILDAVETRTIVPAQVVVTLDGTGSLSTSLLATDDATLNPSGWTWSATILITGASPRSFSFSLPAGSTQDLTTLSPVNGSLGSAVVKGDAGAKGDPTTIVAGTGVSIDSTDPRNPVVSATFGDSALTLDRLPGLLNNGRSYNANVFTQPLATQGGYQYAVWINDSAHPVVGKRRLPHGPWSTYDLNDVAGNPMGSPTTSDGHCSYSIAVDNDGYIHVSGNMHDSPLRYVRSNNPGDITAWTSRSMVGDSLETSQIAYPQFVHVGSEFLFFARPGVSGNGCVTINVYNHTTQTWSRRSKPLSGLASDGASPDESPYITTPAVGADGTLHLFFNWRVTSDVATSHDICHMKSADGGTTWTTANGTALTLPVLPTTTSVKIVTGTYPDPTIINQNGAAVDSLGHPHIAYWSAGASPNYFQQLVQRYWDGAAWQSATLIDRAYYADAVTMTRTALIRSGARMLLLYSKETNQHRTLRLREITPGATAPVNDIPIFSGDLGAYEPVFDRQAADAGTLSLLLTTVGPDGGAVGTGVAPYTAQWGAVGTVNLDALMGAAALGLANVPAERTTVLPCDMLASAGSPTNNASAVGVPCWQMDTAATEVVACAAKVPENWETYNIVLWWCNVSTGTGNVGWQARYAHRAIGLAINGGETNAGTVTVAAGAQYVVTQTTLATGVKFLPGSVPRFNIRRDTTVASNLANDAGILRVDLVRVT